MVKGLSCYGDQNHHNNESVEVSYEAQKLGELYYRLSNLLFLYKGELSMNLGSGRSLFLHFIQTPQTDLQSQCHESLKILLGSSSEWRDVIRPLLIWKARQLLPSSMYIFPTCQMGHQLVYVRYVTQYRNGDHGISVRTYNESEHCQLNIGMGLLHLSLSVWFFPFQFPLTI